MTRVRHDIAALIEEARLSGATSLDLSAQEIAALPASIARLSNLDSLNLSGNKLRRVPASITKLSNLRFLDLSENALTEVPESIGKLRQLEFLNLSRNNLREFPTIVFTLTGLTELSISVNHISILPEGIGQLSELRSLNLSSNRLETLPETVTNLARLGNLNVSFNSLLCLPEGLGKLSALQMLDLSSNSIVALPDSVGQLESLRVLYLSHNHMDNLTPSFSDLANIEDIWLNNNAFSDLPHGFGKLQTIERLIFAHNQFSMIPESIRTLKNLIHLDFENNRIHTLPMWLSELKISHLDLTANQLVELPESLQSVDTLERLYLHGNDELGLPPEVLGPTWLEVSSGDTPANPKDILDYYYRLRRGKRPLNEAKLILVGRGGVGKTSLVNRLVHNSFDTDERKTEGICITDWQIPLSDNENVRLNVWDFGGQEIMHATHQFFLTERSLYLLVLNGRGGGEDADAEYWLKLIDSFGDDSPVIVVMNKIREHPFDLNRRGLQQKYPIRHFIKTDCGREDEFPSGFGIDELRNAIFTETDKLDHLRDAFPTTWFAIKDKLASMEKNYLRFEQFRDFCEAHGESDPQAQEALAGYLHNLGIVLNYRDDPRLQDTHVLNPHWVTNGIYKILNSDMLEKQKGEIRLQDLDDILDAREYPAGMRRFTFDLMKKFDLCFSFPDDDAHYLVPELLDKQEPAETAAFDPKECLNFSYHYPVLPEGLLPRLIVRTQILSEGLPRWRTGVILKFDGNRALVKADVQDKRVTISVLGPQSGRRRLLAVIRSDLERIHRDIKNLQPQEMVPLPQFPTFAVPYQKLLVMERQGIREFPEVVGDKVLTISISELLNGVDLEGTRDRQKTVSHQRQPVRLFYSYSHKDEHLRNELETHLKLLQRQGVIDGWHDRKIDAGDEWKQRINDNLDAAEIVLLLVSADFLASDYCFDIEMGRAMERHERGEARVIPIVIRDVNMMQAPFSKLQALPKDGLAVTKWADRDSAWRNVSEGIQKAIEALPQNRQRRGSRLP